jgi:hypothetical protein
MTQNPAAIVPEAWAQFRVLRPYFRAASRACILQPVHYSAESGKSVSMRMHGLQLLLAGALCATGAAAADSPVVTVTVSPSKTHPISPYIYGISNASGIEGLPPALTLDRGGGNRLTAYNWENNASNAGKDWLYQNDFGGGSGHEQAGAAAIGQIERDRKNAMASLITVQMQGWVAGDANGPVNVSNPPDKSRFKKVFYEKKTVTSDPFTVKPPASDNYVFMDEYVWAIDQKFKDQGIFASQPATQPVFIALDNEPELWNSTHLEVQGKTGITADSFLSRTLGLATAIKKQFPQATIFGPVHYGFMGLYSWSGELGASPTGNNWFADKYLAALKTAGASFGRPLVDVYDFHWYPEATDSAGARITSLMGPNLTDDQVQAIVQSPRSLWDKTYKEKSWISNNVLGGPVYIVDRLQSRINAENPGMKLAITEYDNGGGLHIAGTLAQADNLGVFGARSLFAATMWLLTAKEPYSLAGFRAFRNFDGANHHFGDTSVEAVSGNPAKVAVYVSTDSAHAGRVIMVAINRSAQDQPTTVTGQPVSGTAHLFRMTAATAAKQSNIEPVAAGEQPASGSSITLTLPALSVTTLDIY